MVMARRFPPSWPDLSRPPTPYLLKRRKQNVGGRDIRAFTPVFDGLLPGHDDVEGPGAVDMDWH